jgi:monoamine oxidase
MADSHAIVLGTETGGLAAARSLTRNGFSVVLLETTSSGRGFFTELDPKKIAILL